VSSISTPCGQFMRQYHSSALASKGLTNRNFLLLDSLFPDSMTTHWDTDEISSLLRTTFMTSQSSSGSPKPTIDVLITFDSKGISSHPNHISLFHGARAFISSLTQPGSGADRAVSLYTLTTVGVARKYAGVFDRLFTPLLGRGGMGSHGHVMPSSLVFMHGLGQGGWRTAREAMTAAHVSQMRWFRYGWITLSRYMFINTLELEEVK
jgi:N-acetylglucosaminylphosphatidylinositol deacetylase